jgi:hypothetical protein
MGENEVYALDSIKGKQNQKKVLLPLDSCPAHTVNMQLHKIPMALSSASCTS